MKNYTNYVKSFSRDLCLGILLIIIFLTILKTNLYNSHFTTQSIELAIAVQDTVQVGLSTDAGDSPVPSDIIDSETEGGSDTDSDSDSDSTLTEWNINEPNTTNTNTLPAPQPADVDGTTDNDSDSEISDEEYYQQIFTWNTNTEEQAVSGAKEPNFQSKAQKLANENAMLEKQLAELDKQGAYQKGILEAKQQERQRLLDRLSESEKKSSE